MTGSATYNDKVILVTGSSRGIGKLICTHFLDAGASVIGFSRGEGTIDHPKYRHLRVDIGEPEAVQKAFFDLRGVTDALHIVVNNAAVATSQYAIIMPPEAAKDMVHVNLLGAFMVSREAAKMMGKRKWGRIINISSMMARLEPVGGSLYAACKAGLSTLANVMAKELSHINVTCNTVAVTAIESDMLVIPRKKVEEIITQLPIPRLAHPDDILNVIDFFASERSAYITAQTVYLGGVN